MALIHPNHIVVACAVFCLPLAEAGKLEVPSPEYETIQQAADAASSGDVIEVEKGTYFENVRLERDDVTLLGDGALIDGQFLGPCVLVTGARVTIRGLRLVNGTEGIRVGAPDARIEDNRVFATRGEGIRVEADGVKVIDNTIGACGSVGIAVEASSNTGTTIVDGNDLSQCHGIQLVVGRVLVRGNKIAFAKGGLRVDTYHPSLPSVVAKNDVQHCNGDGIECEAYGAGSILIQGNRLEVIDNDALDLTPTSGEIHVFDNELRGAGGDGVEVNGATGTKSVRIERNVIECVSGDGIHYVGDGAVMIDNRIERAASRGIVLDADSMTPHTIAGNRVRLSGEEGISVAANAVTIAGNVVKKNAFDGIRACGDDNVIRDNDVSKNWGAGIAIVKGIRNKLRFNSSVANGHEGIDNSGQLTLIEGNLCRKNALGVGPDIAGKGHGAGGVDSFAGNDFGTGGADALQRLDFFPPLKM